MDDEMEQVRANQTLGENLLQIAEEMEEAYRCLGMSLTVVMDLYAMADDLMHSGAVFYACRGCRACR